MTSDRHNPFVVPSFPDFSCDKRMLEVMKSQPYESGPPTDRIESGFPSFGHQPALSPADERTLKNCGRFTSRPARTGIQPRLSDDPDSPAIAWSR
jgi:hypothetical protein